MGGSQALVVDRLLAGELAHRRSRLLEDLGARLTRASDLPARDARRETLPAGAPALDRLLPGGLPLGALVEVVGRRSSGRFALALGALAAVTSTGRPAALVDLGDQLDPEAARSAGVDLARLLWVRPGRVKDALAAAEMLLATGFPLVVADLGVAPRTRFIPDAAWVRLARSAQAQGASLLLSTPVRASGIAAEAVVSAGAPRPLWLGSGKAPRLLAGISASLTLEKLGRATPAARAPLDLAVPEAVPRLLKGSVPPTGRAVSYPLSALSQKGEGRAVVMDRSSTLEAGSWKLEAFRPADADS